MDCGRPESERFGIGARCRLRQGLVGDLDHLLGRKSEVWDGGLHC